MAYNKNLHQLIQSLTKKEQTTLTQNISEKEKELLNHYCALEANKESIKNLSRHQGNLKSKLIKQLGRDKIDDKRDEMWRSLREIRELCQRGFIELALQELKKAKKMALHYELFDFMLSLNAIEIDMVGIGQRKINYLSGNEIRAERKKWLHLLENELDYLKLLFRLGEVLIETTSLRSAQEKKAVFEEVQSSPLYQNKKNALSKSNLIRFYDSHRILNTLINNAKETLEAIKKMVDFFQKNPQFQETMPFYYLVILTAALEANQKLGNKDNEIYWKQIEEANLPAYVKDYKFDLTVHLRLNELGKQTKNKALKETQELIQQFKKESVILPLESQVSICISFAKFYIYHKEYQEAEYWIKEYYNIKNEKPKIRKNLLYLAELLQLLLYFEEQDYRNLKVFSNNTYRTFRNRKILYDTEKALLKFFKSNHFFSMNEKELQLKLKNLEDKLIDLAKDKEERDYHQNNFDWLYWLQER